MPEIDVALSGEDDDALHFNVTVTDERGSTSHEVTASRVDVDRLSNPSESPERFVERCFAFLLDREPKESILRSFDVSVIGRYFPEFEAEISS
jgi:hypothetical protein